MNFDILIESANEKRKYFRNYLTYAKKIKEIATKLLGKSEVFVFGSVVEGKHTPSSDIDILIVSENVPKSLEDRAKISAKILKEIDIFAPFELHIVNEKEFEWYRRFLKKTIKV